LDRQNLAELPARLDFARFGADTLSVDVTSAPNGSTRTCVGCPTDARSNNSLHTPRAGIGTRMLTTGRESEAMRVMIGRFTPVRADRKTIVATGQSACQATAATLASATPPTTLHR
jgi:hypothetical protein